MKRNYNIIKLSGLKGVFFAIFIVGCLVAGFITFPAWVCMNIWNFFADMFIDMPKMTMLHGALLWGIVGLSLYALNQDSFSISFGRPKAVPTSEEKLKEILRQINEKNSTIMTIEKSFDEISEDSGHSDDMVDDKIEK